MMTTGNVEQVITSIDDALVSFPAISISEEETKRVLHGNQITCPSSFANITCDHIRLHSHAGTFLGLARIDAGFLKPDLVFS
jgi:tRNA U55 pseudouridine synthase TruB